MGLLYGGVCDSECRKETRTGVLPAFVRLLLGEWIDGHQHSVCPIMRLGM